MKKRLLALALAIALLLCLSGCVSRTADTGASEAKSAHSFSGQTVLLMGDSRSSTDYTFYQSTMAEKTGATVILKGASGRDVAFNASDAYFASFAEDPHDWSVWIVGGNDTGEAGTVGTFRADSVLGQQGEPVVSETDLSADYSGTCFIQAVDHMIRKYLAMKDRLAELNGGKEPTMIFCTDLPQQRENADTPWSRPENWERKRQAILECCEKNGIPCLDLFQLCDFDMSIEPYWVGPTDMVNNYGVYFMDGLHPNPKGIDRITDFILQEMRK